MKFKATIKNSQLIDWKARDINALLKHEFTKVGRWWHRVARPRHFNRGAFQRYGYSPRKGGYNRRKKRRFGHTKPLVFTGETQRLSSTHRITATAKGVTVTYPSVRKLNFKPRGSKVNMRAEFEKVSDAEVKHMTSMMEDSIERKMQTAARNNGRLRIRS